MKDFTEKIKVYQTIIMLSLAGLGAFWYWGKSLFFIFVISLLMMSLVAYPVARYIHLGWMGLAKVLGWINTRILLGLIFYCLLFPLAVIRRLFKAPLIEKAFDAKTKTYYVEKEEQITSADFEQLW